MALVKLVVGDLQIGNQWKSTGPELNHLADIFVVLCLPRIYGAAILMPQLARCQSGQRVFFWCFENQHVP